MKTNHILLKAIWLILAHTILISSNLIASNPFSPPDSSQVTNPCDSNINPTDTLEFCAYSNALPFVYEDSSLTATGYYTFHHVNSMGCDSDVVVHFVLHNMFDGRDQFERITLCSNELPHIEQGTALSEPGLYKFI